MKLSERMIKAGWVINRERNGSFTVYGSGLQEYRFDSQTNSWSDDLEAIEYSLEQDLNSDGTSFVTSSRLTALNHTKNISQPVGYLCREGLLVGKSVLHLGTGMDRFAKDAMLKAGCISVCDYDPNFFPDTAVLNRQYDIVMAHYVLNILPSGDRSKVYKIISDTLKNNGQAYVTVQGLWPVEHKYDIIEAYEDGYLIRTGYNTTFRKGYSEKGLLDEMNSELGGHSKVLTTFYSNTLAVLRRTEA